MQQLISVRTGSIALLLYLLAAAQVTTAEPSTKRVIGETARIVVEESSLTYLARIDTGARITSLHATDIEVPGGVADQRQNIGKQVRFTTENEQQQRVTMMAPIVDVAQVRNAQGVEYRYVIDLKLAWQGIGKRGRVNLRNRSAMSYKLLIGRNWLADDFVVDVDRSEGTIKK